MSKPTDPFDSLKLHNQLCFAVYSAAHAFTAAYKPLLEPLGLTYPQYLVLIVLWEEDGPTVKRISELLRLDPGTLTPVLKRLEVSGFVRRVRDPKDERMVRIYLTDKGNNVRSSALAARGSIVCALGGSEHEIQQLKNSIDHLDSLLRASHEPAAA